MATVSPDDTDKPFVARWNTLVSALIIEPSIKLVARTACDFGIMTGENVFPGNQRLARETGFDERTVREAWHFLRAAGMARRISRSAWTADHRTADAYTLEIPDDWRHWPVYGPHFARFTCLQCGKKFNPQPCNRFAMKENDKGELVIPVTDRDGTRELRWRLSNTAFCPAPRSGNGCCYEWGRSNGPWGSGDLNYWELFRKARGDNWPTPIRAAAA